MALYFAPINLFSNYVYRHIALQCDADYVFSELIMVNALEKAIEDDKLKLIPEDISRTIFQIGVSSPEEVFQGVAFIKEYVASPLEININMGCPHSSMKKAQTCGGLLFNIPLMGELAHALASALKHTSTVASIKLRLGTNPETILIHEYLDIIQKNGVNKVYIHARTLRHSYVDAARYEFFSDLRAHYPEMTLVFNGDVDNLESYENIGSGDVMIGRAALSNPFIFQDIKDGVSYVSGPYAPELKDPNYIRQRNVCLNQKKVDLIKDYLDLASTHDLRKQLYCGNMSYLTKGVSGAGDVQKELNTSKNAQEAKQLFEEWLTKIAKHS